MLSRGVVLSGRYELTERIAAGGMGEVWRATDVLLRREVAVKVLLPALVSDGEFIARFRVEARMMAGLRHPGIVQVHDYGENAEVGGDRLDYLVMEYIEGSPLSKWIKTVGRLGVAETVSVVTQAARALHVAHSAGIVHRDVKPSNLLVRPDGVIVLVDFGVARSADTTGMTSTNVVLGTAHYMAPEQALGRPVSAETDIYALGAVAYCCLTGRPPYTGDNPLQVVSQHLQGDPPTVPSEIPPALAALVSRALAKEPAGRFPSAAAFADAVAAAGHAIQAGSGTGGTAVTVPSSPAGPAAGLGWPTSGSSGTTVPPPAAGFGGPQTGGNPQASGGFGGPQAGGNPQVSGGFGHPRPGHGPQTGGGPQAGAGFGGPRLGGPQMGGVSQAGAGFGGPQLGGPQMGGGPQAGAGFGASTPAGGPPRPAGYAGAGLDARNPGGAEHIPPLVFGERPDPRRRRNVVLAGVAGAVVIAVAGVVAAFALRPADAHERNLAAGPSATAGAVTSRPGAAIEVGDAEPAPSGGPSAPAKSGKASRSSTPSAKAPTAATDKPTADPETSTGSTPDAPATSATSSPANPYTAEAACGSGYQVIDSAALTGSGGAKLGTVYLLYNAGNGYNCTATVKKASVGTKTTVSAYLEVKGSARKSTSGSYAYYAGPVRAKAAGVCVKWGGAMGGASYGSPFEHCD